MPIRLDSRAADFSASFNAFLATKREAMADVETAVRAMVKIRHRHEPSAATIEPINATSARVIFDERQRAVTPGQAAVCYSGDVVLGGGWIRQAEAK